MGKEEGEHSENGSLTGVQPLTKRNTAGDLYLRSSMVEQQIVDTWSLTGREMINRSAISDTTQLRFLKEECLVYLIRERFRAGDDKTADQLALILLQRITTFIRGKFRITNSHDADDAFTEVVNALFLRIFDLESDRADYFQVRFWSGLDRLATDAFRRYLGQQKQMVNALDWESVNETDQIDRTVMSVEDEAILSETIRETSPQVQEALALLDEPYRTAFVLRYVEGWPIENIDPNTETISKYFGKDPRTIRNWLTRAEQRLEAWRGAKP